MIELLYIVKYFSIHYMVMSVTLGFMPFLVLRSWSSFLISPKETIYVKPSTFGSYQNHYQGNVYVYFFLFVSASQVLPDRFMDDCHWYRVLFVFQHVQHEQNMLETAGEVRMNS